jgi:hypothetical protein
MESINKNTKLKVYFRLVYMIALKNNVVALLQSHRMY